MCHGCSPDQTRPDQTKPNQVPHKDLHAENYETLVETSTKPKHGATRKLWWVRTQTADDARLCRTGGQTGDHGVLTQHAPTRFAVK